MTTTYVIKFFIKKIIFRDFLKLVLAFLAMGGDEEKKQAIDSQKLISIVKDEFKLTIDIEVII